MFGWFRKSEKVNKPKAPAPLGSTERDKLVAIRTQQRLFQHAVYDFINAVNPYEEPEKYEEIAKVLIKAFDVELVKNLETSLENTIVLQEMNGAILKKNME